MSKTSIDNLSAEVMKGLTEYANLASDTLKAAARKSAQTAKKQISANAPQKTGRYAKSWAVTKNFENSNSIELTVHSKTRYQLAHLLENGHAKRGGGRVSARPHIKAAEETAVKQFEEEIERGLK